MYKDPFARRKNPRELSWVHLEHDYPNAPNLITGYTITATDFLQLEDRLYMYSLREGTFVGYPTHAEFFRKSNRCVGIHIKVNPLDSRRFWCQEVVRTNYRSEIKKCAARIPELKLCYATMSTRENGQELHIMWKFANTSSPMIE